LKRNDAALTKLSLNVTEAKNRKKHEIFFLVFCGNLLVRTGIIYEGGSSDSYGKAIIGMKCMYCIDNCLNQE